MKKNIPLILGLIVLAGLLWMANRQSDPTLDGTGELAPQPETPMCFEDGSCGEPYPDPVNNNKPVTPPAVVIAPVVGSEINSSNVLSLINATREDAGLPLLAVNSKLTSAAVGKANDMASRSYFAHENPDGNRMAYWLKQWDYPYRLAGEILAVEFATVQAQHEGWMASPTHRAVILNANYREIGIGIAEGDYKESENVDYVAVMVGVR